MTLKRQIYNLLVTHHRVTAAGACHLLRGDVLPPTYTEADRTLDWLARNGYADRHPDTGFGTEYTRKGQ